MGIIGASAERGWRGRRTFPTVQGLPGLELAAVDTRSQDTADAAAAAFGVDRAYRDAMDLIADPTIDLVTVAASVPAHRNLIVAASEGGKRVVTEWPVGQAPTA